jgi:hypothetical protein
VAKVQFINSACRMLEPPKELDDSLILTKFSYMSCLISRITIHRNFSLWLISTGFIGKFASTLTSCEESYVFLLHNLCTWNPVVIKMAWHSIPVFSLILHYRILRTTKDAFDSKKIYRKFGGLEWSGYMCKVMLYL